MADKILQLNTHSDVIMVTYYPLKEDFTVQAPSVVLDDFQFLVDSYSDKPIYIMELGYPSSALCNSSEALQQAFVEQSVAAWDAFQEQIPMLLYLWLNDLSSHALETLSANYGFADPTFAEYLATLGLRTRAASGQDKAAFTRLKGLSAERGW